MKKIIIGFICIAGLFCSAALKESYTQRDVRDPRKLAVHLEDLAYDVKAQVDTNVTTTVTLYTPEYTGQVLVGGEGVGTNAVWISNGVTTNDWIKIEP